MPGIGTRVGPRVFVGTRTRVRLTTERPPEAVTGIEGVRAAEEVLKTHGAVGLLIGGLAKLIWAGMEDWQLRDHHKDVDVLVIGRGCKSHPGRFEAGVDWWVSHSVRERATNGMRTGLYWKLTLKPKRRLAPGLYLCPSELLQAGANHENELLEGMMYSPGCQRGPKDPLYPPLVPAELFVLKLYDDNSPLANRCEHSDGTD